ncbi:MAG TPA: response regulator [Trebonia sp.]|nr:response regulator [Trebonia sp.]
MKAPTRALVVEDVESWVYTLSRAARRAGASEIVVCESLEAVREALRTARFDIAILDVGLDPDDDVNADGIRVLEMIRAVDGDETRCVLVTGWQGGDRMDLQADAQRKHGIEWAYMKEKYEAHAVIAKLTDLLEHAAERRLSRTTPMASLSASMEPYRFENQLLSALNPTGGVGTLYSAASRLVSFTIPLLASNPRNPIEVADDGMCAGVYWSRALATAVAVVLAPAGSGEDDDLSERERVRHLLPAGGTPDLIQRVRERNIIGWLWELPDVARTEFPG